MDACADDAGLASYQSDVAPPLAEPCNGCHGGDSGIWPLSAHEHVADWRLLNYYDLLECRMPPADAGIALSMSERMMLLRWLSCGAPDN